MLPVLTLLRLPPAPFRDGLESELHFSSCHSWPWGY